MGRLRAIQQKSHYNFTLSKTVAMDKKLDPSILRESWMERKSATLSNLPIAVLLTVLYLLWNPA